MNACGTNSIKSSFIFLLLTALCTVMGGCSSSPSAGDGERAIQDRIKQESEGRIKLTKFQKTNGVQGELMGVKIYSLEFDAEIQFTEDRQWFPVLSGQELSFQTTKPPVQNSGNLLDQFMASPMMNLGKLVKKGQRVQLSGVVRFVKKEKGWAVDGLEPSRVNVEGGSGAATQTAPMQAQGASVQTLESYREKAEKGDAKTQYELARIYANGEGVDTNANEALKWFRKAANQGYAPGQNGLGWMYLHGVGVSKDEGEAARWFRMAADKGDPKAQVNLGQMYFFGQSVAEDRNESAKLYRKAAESGNSSGQYLLGVSYILGEGVPRDTAEAIKWYRKAAEQGDQQAQLQLGGLYEIGDGVPQNRDTAVEWYRKVASGGDGSLKESANKKLRELFPNPAQVARRDSVLCVNNLKQIGLAFKLWASYHDDKYPFNVSTNGGRGRFGPITGGTMEFCSTGIDGFDSNAFLAFRATSEWLGTTEILVCPSDSGKKPALDFNKLLSTNVSYQVRSGPNINETNPNEILGQCPIHRHTLKCDGSVQAMAIQ